ncbi:hypothetical protein D7B24_000052 [Verticillium nonalfalfae]|uniref:Uncharacterized protein n=1 Tax=Verticillium nonalfalfae TaxID=1051616 RepID=A0A3M9YL89_9PEZI|nr:uncharacterized protein D7B24_000052 [Verticillium nonalfalfae]RNJ61199.1 hypothetical protein D7B24_000052 [Verticillium nonalfalfae]
MATYIYINGYPAVGKLTVAKELEKRIPQSKIYDNHLMIDGVAALVERSSPHYQDLRTAARRFFLDIISTHDVTDGVTWIFTDSREKSAEAAAAAQDYKDAAARRNVPFVSVILHCDAQENERRILGEGRGGRTNTKLVDVEILRQIRREEGLHRFGGDCELELDITNLEPAVAAETIRRHVEQVT